MTHQQVRWFCATAKICIWSRVLKHARRTNQHQHQRRSTIRVGYAHLADVSTSAINDYFHRRRKSWDWLRWGTEWRDDEGLHLRNSRSTFEMRESILKSLSTMCIYRFVYTCTFIHPSACPSIHLSGYLLSLDSTSYVGRWLTEGIEIDTIPCSCQNYVSLPRWSQQLWVL